MQLYKKRTVKVDGYHHSDVYFTVALVVLKTGGVGMAIDGLDPSLQNLADIRNLMDGMVKEIDRKLPQLVQQNVNEIARQS